MNLIFFGAHNKTHTIKDIEGIYQGGDGRDLYIYRNNGRYLDKFFVARLTESGVWHLVNGHSGLFEGDFYQNFAVRNEESYIPQSNSNFDLGWQRGYSQGYSIGFDHGKNNVGNGKSSGVAPLER